jgi:hypothetical protein
MDRDHWVEILRCPIAEGPAKPSFRQQINTRGLRAFGRAGAPDDKVSAGAFSPESPLAPPREFLRGESRHKYERRGAVRPRGNHRSDQTGENVA